MKKSKLKKEYSKMLKMVENHADNVSYPRINNYICQSCGHITKTMDSDKGVTPFIHECEECGAEAYSTFYNDRVPNAFVTQEWYRPSIEECKKLSEGELQHVLQGGLVPRKIIDVLKERANS